MSLAELDRSEADRITVERLTAEEIGRCAANKLMRVLQEKDAAVRSQLCKLVMLNVNDPRQPQQTVAHETLIAELGIKPASTPEFPASSLEEVVFTNEDGFINRQIIMPSRYDNAARFDAALHTHTPDDLMVIMYYADHGSPIQQEA